MGRSDRRRIVTAACVVVVALGAAGSGAIMYVDDDASAPGTGLSWTNAYRCLQDALATAQPSDEIRVARGVYKPDQRSVRTRSGYHVKSSGIRTETFQLKNGVGLKGGYAGIGEPDPDVRDVRVYDACLSGDLAGNDVVVNDARDLLEEPNRAENSFHVVTGSGTDSTAGLDGFTITGGSADGSGPYSDGAGMYNDLGDPTIDNCTFRANRARGGRGGAMFNGTSSPAVSDCLFHGNFSAFVGGAIFNVSASRPKLTMCTFVGNHAGSKGGGVFNKEGSPELTDCFFRDNVAGEMGGGMFNCVGSDPVLLNCVFVGNGAAKEGGGIANENSCTDSVVDRASWPKPFLLNCRFSGNFAERGGAIMNSEGHPVLVNCTLYGNMSRERGGGIYCRYGLVELGNCILWSDAPQEICVEGDAPLVAHSDIQGGWPGEGDIDVDPSFAAPGRWDPNSTAGDPNDDFFVEGDYHLKSQAGRWDPNSQSWVKDDVTSPCIDAGDPNSPIGPEPFPNGGRINIGAYGGTAEASKSYFGEPPCETIMAGDINGDCKVDLLDLLIVVSQWTEGAPPDVDAPGWAAR